MTGSRYRPSAIDGLPARISGQWAKEKLKYLDKYMHLFNVGMKNRWHNRVFLDLLAGCGKCVDEDTGEEFDGSPLRAIKCEEPFTRVICVESETGLADALEQRTKDEAHVIRDDCNNPRVIEQLRGSLGYGILGLAFVDNLGLDVPLSTIGQLTEGRLIDLFIVFQIGDIKRNIRDVLAGRDEPDRFDAFFGAGWKDVAAKAERENLTADETTTRLLDFYAGKLNGPGYNHIGHSRRVMKNSTGVGLYRLILAGRHERAVDFFNKVSAIDPWGQRDLGFDRHLNPSSAIEEGVLAATLMWMSAKLFQKKGHAGSCALIAKISKPQFLCWARTSLAFTSSNQPVNTSQIDFVERAKQGLGADEPNRGGDAA